MNLLPVIQHTTDLRHTNLLESNLVFYVRTAHRNSSRSRSLTGNSIKWTALAVLIHISWDCVYFLCILHILYFVLWTIVILCAIDMHFIKCKLLFMYSWQSRAGRLYVTSIARRRRLHVRAKLPFLCFSRVVAVSAASQWCFRRMDDCGPANFQSQYATWF